jgi:hypothetical protein
VGVLVGALTVALAVEVGVAVGLMVVMGVGGAVVGVGEAAAPGGRVEVGVDKGVEVAASPPQAARRERTRKGAVMITQDLKGDLLSLRVIRLTVQDRAMLSGFQGSINLRK